MRNSPRQIRPIAIGILWRGAQLLVFEAHDPSKQETFYRPIGGGIEFGESGVDAIRREFREELGVELSGVRYLETLESRFTFDGEPAHELVRVYEVEIADSSVRDCDEIQGLEDGTPFRVVWKALSEFESAPLYPAGLGDLLEAPGRGS